MLRVANLITIQHGKVLLVRSKEGDWNFPGGKADKGEAALHAMLRELTEELPKLEVIWPIAAGSTFHGETPNSRKPLQVSTFLADVKGSIEPGAEIKESMWAEHPPEGITPTSAQIWESLIFKGRLTQ